MSEDWDDLTMKDDEFEDEEMNDDYDDEDFEDDYSYDEDDD